jgi:hypothetical protein
MDHITQLYQNRAKVLQEEVNRLEKLLKEVAEPPVDMAELARKAKEKKIKEIQDAEDAQDKQDALDKAKAEQEAKFAEEHPVYAFGNKVGEVAKSAAETGTSVGSFAIDNPITTGGIALAGLLGLDLLRGQVQRKTSLLGKALPTTAQLAGKTIEKTGEWWNKSKIEAAKAEKAAEAQRLADAAEKIRQTKLAGEMGEINNYSANVDRMPGGRLPFDPNDPAVEGRPAGKGAPTPKTRPGAYEAARLPGGPGVPLEPESIARIQRGGYSYPAMLADPDVLKAGLEGAKDIAMTGKEVAGKVVKAATTPLPGSSSAIASGLAYGGAQLVGNLAGENLVKPAAEKAGVFKAVESGTRSALSAAPDWVAKVADPALGVAQTAIQVGLDPLGSVASAMGAGFEEKQRKEFEAMLKAGKPSAVRITPSMKM